MRVDNWLLVNESTGTEVNAGDPIVSFRGIATVCTGGRPPHKLGSTGKVWTASGADFYPSVFGLKWINISPLNAYFFGNPTTSVKE